MVMKNYVNNKYISQRYGSQVYKRVTLCGISLAAVEEYKTYCVIYQHNRIDIND